MADEVKLPRVILADDHLRFCSKPFASSWNPNARSLAPRRGRSLLQIARVRRPDLIVLDVAMPIMNGLEAARQVKSELPDVKIIFLTMNEDPDIAQALHLGACGYLLKKSAATELFKAIRYALSGRTYITPLIAQGMERSFIRGPRQWVRPKSLTPRQREVVQLLAKGKSMKEGADLLNLTPRTVAFHKYRVMEELEIKTNAGLVQFDIRNYMVAYGFSQSTHSSYEI
jgi:DNA-binding NarL/FixJ family response regulator